MVIGCVWLGCPKRLVAHSLLRLMYYRMLGGAGVPPGVSNRSWRRPLVAARKGESSHRITGTADLAKKHLERGLTEFVH